MLSLLLFFRTFWNFIILHVFVFDKVLFRYTSTFMFDVLPISLFYFGALLDLIIVIDLFISLKTGYIDYEAKRVILDANKCLIKFCTQKLFIHFASIIPFNSFLLMRYGTDASCGLCKCNRFICALKIVSSFRLFRVFEASAFVTRKRYRTRKIYFYKFLRIIVTGCSTVIQFNDIFDAFTMLVFIQANEVDRASSLGLRISIKYGVLKSDDPDYRIIVIEMYRVLNIFCMFTFGTRTKVFLLDKLASVVAYLIAAIFHVWWVLTCFALISSLVYSRDQVNKMRTNTLNLISSQQLSEHVRTKVDRYFRLRTTQKVITMNANRLYRSLPLVFKHETKMHTYMKLIMRIPLFCDWPLVIVEELVLILQEKVYLENDIVTLVRIVFIISHLSFTYFLNALRNFNV